MEKFFRALGMVDKDGRVFDETQIREQVMRSFGVSAPTIETVPAPKPPFRNYSDCFEACLALPDPSDPAFPQCSASVQALAVTAVFEMELSSGGVQQYLWSCGSTYALRTADSLREIGLPDHAAAFERYLNVCSLDAAGIDALRPAGDPDSDAAEEQFLALYKRFPSDGFAADANWRLLQTAILDYANSHPEAFDTPD